MYVWFLPALIVCHCMPNFTHRLSQRAEWEGSPLHEPLSAPLPCAAQLSLCAAALVAQALDAGHAVAVLFARVAGAVAVVVADVDVLLVPAAALDAVDAGAFLPARVAGSVALLAPVAALAATLPDALFALVAAAAASAAAAAAAPASFEIAFPKWIGPFFSSLTVELLWVMRPVMMVHLCVYACLRVRA